MHTGTMKGETYARVFRAIDGRVGYQFKGFRDADLNSDIYKGAESVEMAIKICEAMMGAWKHKAD